jgi:hypothetical protein
VVVVVHTQPDKPPLLTVDLVEVDLSRSLAASRSLGKETTAEVEPLTVVAVAVEPEP